MAEKEKPPRVLGVLLGLVGVALCVLAGIYYLENRSFDPFATVAGIGFLWSGVLLYKGRGLVLRVYGVTLAAIWLIAAFNADGSTANLLLRVAIPSILGLYIFSSRVQDTLR
jgi:hypothetical protein